MTVGLLVSGLIICLLLSAFFSASEMSFSSCNVLRLENLKDEGNKRAARAYKVIQQFDDALGAILIGNNLVNIAASSIGSVLVIELLGSDKYAWISTAVITVLVIIFGETIPKIIAKKKSNSMALVFSGPVRCLEILLLPLVKLTLLILKLCIKEKKESETDDPEDIIDEAIDELSSIIETAEDEEVLDEDQSELVREAIDFLDISAFEAMTSRVDLVTIDIDDERSETESIIFNSDCSRIPVYRESTDNIIGILLTNHYLKAKTETDYPDIESLLLEPCYVYKTTKLTSVLEQLRNVGQHMAIVCDEYGGTLGVITIEDIMEEIVGEIWDENDEIEIDVKEISETRFELDGDISINEFCELMGIDEEEFETDSDTAGGWVLEHFETYPECGAEFNDDNLFVRILDIEERRVLKLYVEILPENDKNA